MNKITRQCSRQEGGQADRLAGGGTDQQSRSGHISTPTKDNKRIHLMVARRECQTRGQMQANNGWAHFGRDAGGYGDECE